MTRIRDVGVCHTRVPETQEIIFAIPAQDWTLKAPQLAIHFKKLVDYFKLDTTCIGAHSLRIGGASTLAAAGLTDNEIMHMGSWHSTAFLTYIRQNIALFEKARTAMASGKHLTLEDVRRFNQN